MWGFPGTVCNYAGCTRPKNTGGLCIAHARQKRLGQELAPLLKCGPNLKARAEAEADAWLAEVKARKAAR